MSYIQCQKCGAYYGAIGNKFVPCACLPIMEKCGHNDQFGICPLERGHSGEHTKVPHRSYSDAELAKAEALGVRSGLEMAAEACKREEVKCRNSVICHQADESVIRALIAQPIPQAPQGDSGAITRLEIVAESIIAMLGSAYAQQGNTAHPGEKWSQMVLAELKAIAKQPVPQAPQAEGGE